MLENLVLANFILSVIIFIYLIALPIFNIYMEKRAMKKMGREVDKFMGHMEHLALRDEAKGMEKRNRIN